MLDEAIRSIPDFPVKLANELKHCVIAHHGELEYGSPKKPALAEALALNLADNADAKMQTLTEIFKGKTGNDWLGYNRLFESISEEHQECRDVGKIAPGRNLFFCAISPASGHMDGEELSLSDFDKDVKRFRIRRGLCRRMIWL